MTLSLLISCRFCDAVVGIKQHTFRIVLTGSGQERKRSRKEGHTLRLRHVLWNATKIALFIWLVIRIWKYCSGRSGGTQSSINAGTYAKLDEDGQQGGAVWYVTLVTPTGKDRKSVV